MKSSLLAFLIFSALTGTALSQFSLPPLSMNAKDKSITGSTANLGEVALAVFPLNPILMIEGEKFYAGITKEIAIGFFPYGRIAAEYSLIFRETRVNHLRFSYNYDFPVEVGDFAAFMISVGGGYFTDFDKEGYFPQASLSLLFPLTDNISTNPYFKLRRTFMKDKEESDISDVSFGFSLCFIP
jgi:hypothetical protein